MIAEEAKTTITRENRFLKLDPAQRLEAVNQLVAEIKENPNPSEKLKQDYADSIIAFQHLISDLSTDKENPLDSQDASEFAQLFATHAEILAHNNILLPGKPEYKPANSETTATSTEVTTEYVRELVKINQELSKHTSEKKEPTAEEKKQYTDVLISFQHFLAKEYHLAKTQNPAAKLHTKDFVIVEQSLKYFAVIVNRLAIFGIKLPTGEISASPTESPQVPTELPAEVPNESRANLILGKFKSLVSEIKARYPGLSESVQQTIARGITRFQESSRVRNEADLAKRKKKFLREIEKSREKQLAKDKAESERVKGIENKLAKLNQGDKVKLLDTKGKTAEVHTVIGVDLNKKYLTVDIYYPNQKTRQKLEGRTRYFDYYTDLNNAAAIDITKKKQEKTQTIDTQTKKEINWKLLEPGSATIDNQVVKDQWVINPQSQQRELVRFTKANQDDMGFAQVKDYRDPNKQSMRYVLADGAGGSSSIEESVKVKNAMREFIRQAVHAGKSLQESAFEAANYIYDQINVQKNPNLIGCGAFIAAEILSEKIDICWRGDPVALLWKSGQPFEHRRSEYTGNQKIRGKKSQFQMQNFVENQVNYLHAAEPDNTDASRKTQFLDKHDLANVIVHAIGNKPLRKVDDVSHFSVAKEQVIASGAEFLLLMCDGAQPNNMIAMDANNSYNKEVNRIMTNLSQNKINATEAAQQITQASRTINQDEDDISVMVVDLRSWKAT
ncbi:hypothetical protein KA017_03770 [Candidatus Woesebacteria bacterium]|nr:hypothetical protein [Candidatus Woesebacteria bacterium]